jgi:hypothetical protein
MFCLHFLWTEHNTNQYGLSPLYWYFFPSELDKIDVEFTSMVIPFTKSLIQVVADKTSHWIFLPFVFAWKPYSVSNIIIMSILTTVFVLQLCELSFQKTHHLRNPYNDNLPVKVGLGSLKYDALCMFLICYKSMFFYML